MQCMHTVVAEWKDWSSVSKTISMGKMTSSQVTYTLKSEVLDTLQRILSVDPFPLQRFLLGDSECGGRCSTHGHCYIFSIMLSFLGFLSHRLIFSLARRVRGRVVGIPGCFAVLQGTQGCTGIQWAWLRLICLETSCGHIYSTVPNMPWWHRKIYVVI